MSETKPPSIPDISDSNLVAAARRIKNLLEIREGRAGNPVDGFVTFRDLVRLGLGKVRDGSTTISGFKRLPVTALPFLDPNSYDGTRDFTKPPTPTGLAAAAVGSVVILTWSILTYPNHDYFEVWRSETDDLAKATMIGSPVGTVFTDPAGENRVYFYWVRAVSMAAVQSSYNSLSGTSVATGSGAGGGAGGTADSTLEAQIVTLGENLQSQIDSLTQSLSALALRVYDLEAWKAQAVSQLNMLMVQFQNHANRLAALEANSRVTGRRTRTERLLLTSTLADRVVLRGVLSEALALGDALVGTVVTPSFSSITETLSLGDSYTGDIASTAPGAGSALPVTTGLLAWFDASDSGTITESGGTVSQWDDRSGNGNHATQATSANRPALATGPNGYGVIDFGPFGATDGDWVGFTEVSGKTFVAVVENSGGGGFLFGHTGSYPFHPTLGGRTGSPILDPTYSSAALRTGSATTRRSGHVVNPTTAFKETGWHVIVFRTDGTAIPVNRLFNDRGLPSAFGGAKLAEVAIYDSVLSNGDVETIEAHLAQKWNCTDRLPAGHSGRSAALPSLPITPTPAWWLDASDASYRYGDGTYIRELLDLSGNGKVAERIMSGGDSNTPTLLSAEQNGLDAVDFGTYGSGGKTLGIGGAVSGKTFAIVLYAGTGYGGGYIFSALNTYDFHRAGDPGVRTAAMLATYASSALLTTTAETRLNGSAVDPTSTGLADGWQIVVFRTNGGTASVDQLFRDRNWTDRLGGAKFGEQLVFADVLGTTDVEALEGYLAHKWGIAASLPGGHPYKSSPP